MALRFFTPEAAEQLLIEAAKVLRERAENENCNIVFFPDADETSLSWEFVGDLITDFDSLKMEVQLQNAQFRDKALQHQTELLTAMGFKLDEGGEDDSDDD